MDKATYLCAAPYAKDSTNLPVASVDEAVPFYEKFMGFQATVTTDQPVRRVLLQRDAVEIGLAENGGDPAQEGCFFEVDDVQAAFDELKANGVALGEPNFRVDKHGETTYRVFFIIAPDGLCYCIGQRLP